MKTATPTVPKSEEIDAVWNTKIKIDLILSQKKLLFYPVSTKPMNPSRFNCHRSILSWKAAKEDTQLSYSKLKDLECMRVPPQQHY